MVLVFLGGLALPLDQFSLGALPGSLSLSRVLTVVGTTAVLLNSGLRTPWSTLHPAIRRLLLAFAAVWCFSAMSMIWAPDTAVATRRLVALGTALAFAGLLAYLVGNSVKLFRAMVYGCVVAMASQAFIAVWEIRSGSHLTYTFDTQTIWNSQLSYADIYGSIAWGTLGNPNELAGFLLFAIALLIGTRLSVGINQGAWLASLPVIGLAVVIGWTSAADARGFRMGVCGLGLIVLLDWIRRRARSSGLAATISPLAVVIALVVWLTLRPDLLGNSSGNAGSDELRVRLLKAGLSNGLDNMGLGNGLGSEAVLIESGQLETNLHNVFAAAANDLGIFAMSALLVYLSLPLLAWLFDARGASARRPILLRCLVAWALLIQGFVASSVLLSPWYWVGIAVLAMAHGFGGSLSPTSTPTVRIPTTGPRLRSPRRTSPRPTRVGG